MTQDIIKMAVAAGSRQLEISATAAQTKLDFANGDVVFNISQYRQSNLIDPIQSILVDNTENPYTLYIVHTNLNNFSIPIPPYSFGAVPLLVGADNGLLTFSTNSAFTSEINVAFLSLIVPFSTWGKEGVITSTSISTNNVSIPISQQGSTGFAISDRKVLGILCPDLTGTEFELQGSLDDAVYYSIYNAAGQKAVYDCSGGAGIYETQGEGFAPKYLRIYSNAVEAAARTITFILE